MQKKPVWRKILMIVLILILILVTGLIALVGVTERQFRKAVQAGGANTALMVVTVNGDGTLQIDGSEILLNPDEPLVMASAMKTVVLAAYAQAVVDGVIDPQAVVSIPEWESYYLPGTDGGAHQLGLNSLGFKANPDGTAQDQAASVSYDDLARIMMHYSGNAATDVLIAALGQERLAAAMAAAGMQSHTPICLLLETTLVWMNHEDPPQSEAELLTVTDRFHAEGCDSTEWVEKYRSDPVWRKAQIEFLAAAQTETVDDPVEQWRLAKLTAEILPKGTAREYAQLLALAATGNYGSPEVSGVMQAHLETSPTNGLQRLLFFRRHGEKPGATAGVLTEVSYAVPKWGQHKGETRVVVILANELPASLWQRAYLLESIYLSQVWYAMGFVKS